MAGTALQDLWDRCHYLSVCQKGRMCRVNFYCPIDATVHRSYSDESSEHGTNNRFSSLRKSFRFATAPYGQNHSSPRLSSIRRPICKEMGARNEPVSLQKG